jgi:hypothetical protein
LRIEDRGLRIEDRGSRIEDGGSRIEDGGSRMEDRRMEDGRVKGQLQIANVKFEI